MAIIIRVLLIIAGSVVIYFLVPYSPVSSEYKKIEQELKNTYQNNVGFLSKENIDKLPTPLQNYIITNGYIGTPIVNSLQIKFENVDFILNKGDSPIKVDYNQINIASKPIRVALTDTSLYGIPFQGLDKFVDGSGSMKGVLAKNFTLFDEGGSDFNISSMLTYLSESVLMPSVLIQDFFTFEEINDYNIKVFLNYYGQTVSGIFTFNAFGEIISFKTNERTLIDTNGVSEQIPWEIKYLDYKKNSPYIQPSKIQVIWHYKNESSIYFDGSIKNIQYN